MISKDIKINKEKKFISSRAGFTLVEAMFAVFILTFVITGLMTVVANSLFAARYSKDEITANYLSQEVIDYIRNDRDTTVLLQNTLTPDEAWTNFWIKYSACSVSSGGCSLHITQNTNTISQDCNSSGCPYLYYDENATSNSFYTYTSSGNKITKFQRKIVVSKNSVNSDEIDVVVTVSWKNGGANRTRVLETSFLRY
ncbi:MAG: prepilin-type N-terminal cleavage/methylation domain-containing protein [Candidatus Paceibacterota bacterium]